MWALFQSKIIKFKIVKEDGVTDHKIGCNIKVFCWEFIKSDEELISEENAKREAELTYR